MKQSQVDSNDVRFYTLRWLNSLLWLSSSRIGRKTVGPVSCRVGVGDVNFPRTRLLCGGCPPLGWDGWKTLIVKRL